MIHRSMHCSTTGSRHITGCRMSLSVMSDHYVEVILEALANTDTHRVWKQTDSLGTLFRGQQMDVVSVTKQLFLKAYRPHIHMTASLTYSKGCPGDSEADYLENETPLTELISEPYENELCEATISFYAFGVEDYMDHIYHVIDIFKQKGVMSAKSHYSTILSGTIKDVFEAYQAALSYGAQHLSHYVIETHLSVNSPSHQKGDQNEK